MGEKKKKERFIRKDENDGWCEILKIWRPKATVDPAFVQDKVKSKWFRDPNTDQWVNRDRVKPREN